MLKLINIKLNSKTIEADYVPEDSRQSAHITLNIDSEEYKAEEIEEYGPTYSRMAANGLLRTLEELRAGRIKDAPESRTVMWY